MYSEFAEQSMASPTTTTSTTTTSRCQMDLQLLTDRTKMSKYIAKIGAGKSNVPLPKYEKYIQSKLKRLRSGIIDNNYQIQQSYDALMNAIVADVDRRLDTLKPDDEDSMFGVVYNSDDEYITEVMRSEDIDSGKINKRYN